MKLMKTITAAIAAKVGVKTMKNNNLPAMSGLDSNGQLTYKTATPVKRTRAKDPYAICNIGKRMWNPINDTHVDFQEFYRLVREENIDLSLL